MAQKFAPLEIKCTSTDCENGLHCFKQTKKMAAANNGGRCRSCGAELVEWDRVHKRDLTDVRYTFEALKLEMVRHYFWHIDIDQHAIDYARRKGKKRMKDAIEHRLRQSVAPIHPFHDGYQTPTSGNPVYYAQHATASCCRKCIEEWHGILQGRELEEEEITYLAELATLYIEERLPDLMEEGEKVPSLRKLRKALHAR